ncbi:hypothetical protein CIL03_10325 [Virgibacillus indicus]|uniref:HTH cro/C1-type domain-containing protein n=1 Tax=Virgibacillus indicus TaxID=2024554 RepID=A0A265NBL6_9BACI|nr:helix-turn-helix transcriptional regulator [Virgibacillus indicus]OZU88676.1 hypothetical protein CIL03_10325 [Virgibacillus indicus]
MEAKQFGVYIKKIREEKDLSIRQLELYSGVSNSYLSQLENGKRGVPSPEIIRKLSKGLKTSYADLLLHAGYIDNNETDSRQKYIDKIANEFPDADLMFNDLASLSEKQLEEVYDFIKYKASKKNK